MVRYSVSNADGSWTTSYFAMPPDQEDRQPQLAIDGQTLWVAYSRNNPATCGFSWAGVYYRKRTLPNGSWSVPKLLGRARPGHLGDRELDDPARELRPANRERLQNGIAQSPVDPMVLDHHEQAGVCERPPKC